MSDSSDDKIDPVKPALGGAQKAQAALDALLGDATHSDVKIKRAKKSKNIVKGKCNILATFNNTHVNFTDMGGNVISWSNAGKCNFRGARKPTAYAAQVIVQDAGRTAMSHGLKEVTIVVKGPGIGRDSAIRSVQSLGLIVDSIVDVTAIPHGGCRPRKARRV
jgi:small subunit ribosomal protein S11